MNQPQRNELLSLLHRHALRVGDAHEAAMTESTIRFVEETIGCLLRSQTDGHLTGSAWIVDAPRTQAVLTHHRKLDRWLQLGGHADGNPNLWNVAEVEAREESGLTRLRPITTEIFDLDRHEIPEMNSTPKHFHYDLRFIFEADACEPLVVSSESKDLAWVPLDLVQELNSDESIARMVRKTRIATALLNQPKA